MPHINITITLDNIESNLDAHQIASMIEGIIHSNTGIDNIQTSINDNDSMSSSNPILANNMLRRIR